MLSPSAVGDTEYDRMDMTSLKLLSRLAQSPGAPRDADDFCRPMPNTARPIVEAARVKERLSFRPPSLGAGGRWEAGREG